MAKRCWDLVLLAISFSLAIAGSARNITVDNLDRSVTYTGDWKVHKSSFAYDGAMSFSQDRGATASFTFTGVAVYYLAPRTSSSLTTLLTLDSRNPAVIGLMSPSPPLSSTVLNDDTGDSDGFFAAEQSSVLWGLSDLSNAQHTIVASMWASGTFVVVDAFIYTVVDEEEEANTTVPISVSTTSTVLPFTSSLVQDTPHSAPRQRYLKILTTVIGIIAIISIVTFLLYHRRRKPRHAPFGSPNALSPLSKLALRRQVEARNAAGTPLAEFRKQLQDSPRPSGQTRPMSATPESQSQSESDYEEELPAVPPLLRLPSDLHIGLGDIIPWPATPNRVSRARPSFIHTHFRSSVREHSPLNPAHSSRNSGSAVPGRFYQLHGTTPPELSFRTFSTSTSRSGRPTDPLSSDTPLHIATTPPSRSLTDKFQSQNSYSTFNSS